MRIAVIGAGVAGNLLANRLCREHEITMFESEWRLGGHSHTHTVRHENRDLTVDTGFIVFNARTYPEFCKLLVELDVDSQLSEMSFSVQCARSGLEYNGTSLNSLFAQRRNLARPAFWRMILDILRFNREAPALLESADDGPTLEEYLQEHRYSRAFIRHYILPMGAAIWSAGTRCVSELPAVFFVRFFHHHGMLSIDDRPQWLTIRGGSACYVEKLTAPFREHIRVDTPVESVRRAPGQFWVKPRGVEAERYDRVFFACHSDQALALLENPHPAEREVLSAIGYHRSDVLLHTDTSLLPKRRLAWAAWNYHLTDGAAEQVAVTYNMNLLQRHGTATPLLVTLNHTEAVAPNLVLKHMSYEHPVYTPRAIAAQARHAEINGLDRAYFAGAYWGFGFHEDAVVSALRTLDHFHEREHAQRPVLRTA